MSKFFKNEDKLFKTETCSISVLPLHKFIKMKSTWLTVKSGVNIRPSLSVFFNSQQN